MTKQNMFALITRSNNLYTHTIGLSLFPIVLVSDSQIRITVGLCSACNVSLAMGMVDFGIIDLTHLGTTLTLFNFDSSIVINFLMLFLFNY